MVVVVVRIEIRIGIGIEWTVVQWFELDCSKLDWQ